MPQSGNWMLACKSSLRGFKCHLTHSIEAHQLSVLQQVFLSLSALSSLFHKVAAIMKPSTMSDQFWIKQQVFYCNSHLLNNNAAAASYRHLHVWPTNMNWSTQAPQAWEPILSTLRTNGQLQCCFTSQEELRHNDVRMCICTLHAKCLQSHTCTYT